MIEGAENSSVSSGTEQKIAVFLAGPKWKIAVFLAGPKQIRAGVMYWAGADKSNHCLQSLEESKTQIMVINTAKIGNSRQLNGKLFAPFRVILITHTLYPPQNIFSNPAMR